MTPSASRDAPIPMPPRGWQDRVLALVRAARRAHLPITTAATIDAMLVLATVDPLDRSQLREGLGAVLITSPSHRRTFDDLFDVYFPRRVTVSDTDPVEIARGEQDGRRPQRQALDDHLPEEDRPSEPAAELPDIAPDADEIASVDPEAWLAALTEAVESGDEAALRRAARAAVETLGRVDSHDGQAAYYRYLVWRRLDEHDLLATLLRAAAAATDEPLSPFEEQLLRDRFTARLRQFRAEVDADVRRRAVERRGADRVADAEVSPPLEAQDLFRLSPSDDAELRELVRRLARQVAVRRAARRRSVRRGAVDIRRSLRRSLSTGGVPFELVTQHRPRRRPELFLLCDVSSSVASFARFTLHLVHALQEQLGTVRLFAFVDLLDEVTDQFVGVDPAVAAEQVLGDARVVGRFGHSDYGAALTSFEERYGSQLSARSTVIILGDARTNDRPANPGALRAVQRRARASYWLNPEPRRSWDVGDSVASVYARYVDDMVEVRNLAQLTRFVERLPA